MRRFLMLVLTLVSALALGSHAQANDYTAAPSRAAAAASTPKTTCQTLLGNNSYQCNVTSSLGGTFTDCFQFFSPGKVSSNFDLVVIGYNPFLHMGCACGAKGSLSKPTFNAGTNFVCDTGDGFNFGGKASKTKISKGFVESQSGSSFVFECTPSATSCGASPSGAFLN
jgi:hypothetical protein